MSLSAKERILKLRETEFKLQRLQHDIVNGSKTGIATMSEFLAEHNELMALPTNTRDTIPNRYSFIGHKKYTEAEQGMQKLTLPPKLDSASNSRLKNFKEPLDELERAMAETTPGVMRHPSKGLHSFIHDLDRELDVKDKAAKSSAGFPKVLANKSSKHYKTIVPLNSDRYVKLAQKVKSKINSKLEASGIGGKSLMNNELSERSTSYLYLRDQREGSVPGNSTDANENDKSTVSSKTTLKVNKNDIMEEVSKLASATASLLLNTTTDSELSSSNRSLQPIQSTQRSRQDWHLPREEELFRIQNSLAYGVGTSNLMGVILPPTSPRKKAQIIPNNVLKLETNTTNDKNAARDKNGNAPALAKDNDSINGNADSKSVPATESKSICRKKKKIPERKSLLPAIVPPHERGLIGVEISEFLPQCSVFYRDTNGMYNPHLPHSKAVEKSMEKSGYYKSTILIKMK